MPTYADPTVDVPVQIQQGGKIHAIGAGGVVGMDPGSTSDLSGVAAASSFTSGADNITAHAGGGQASAVQLTAVFNRVTTVATIADSVKLPATSGLVSPQTIELTIANAAANSLNVFPATGDQINGAGANTAYALAGGKTATFFSTTPGSWHALLSA